ncbi:MAG: Mov34/MPN/PAD-1 family protein [Desulfomonilia bacterium]|nr:Mov34/MPN/PAD-1 family protein [Desulfomonilia bacterium]
MEMKIIGIRDSLLELLLRLGESSHPREFLAILLEHNGIIEEMELVPGTETRESSASFSISMLPLNPHTAGSAHSHPNGVLRPSGPDLRYFPSTGRYHLIIGPPYTRSSWRCYNSNGTPVSLEVIP